MEQEKEGQVNYGIVNRGLSRMLPGKFGTEEKIEQVKAEKETLTKDRSKNRIACKHCKKITEIGNFCNMCGKPQR